MMIAHAITRLLVTAAAPAPSGEAVTKLNEACQRTAGMAFPPLR
jgi:hypothetical protein